jgi:hypothetical protein
MARDYIERHGEGDADYTMKIRDVVRNAIENRDTSNNVLMSLTELLGMDAKGISSEEISALASVIFDFVKEEVEKE